MADRRMGSPIMKNRNLSSIYLNQSVNFNSALLKHLCFDKKCLKQDYANFMGTTKSYRFYVSNLYSNRICC